MEKLVLVDGNALLHRAYHATPPLSTSKGELVNAAYGFTLLILKAIDDLKPDYIAVAWDMKAPTFRHVKYADYKGKRGPADEALSNQYDRVFEILRSFSIPEFKLPGFEADDLIGALSVQAAKADLEVIILTGDRDIMQLINSKVKVLMPKKTITDVGLYGESEFRDRFGFEPIKLIEYKALAGDASDNIPGVLGIGDVSATKLIQKYQTLEKIYQSLDELPERLKKLLIEGRDSAYQSRELATIQTEIPIKLDLTECRVHQFDKEVVIKLFEELEFKSLINRIPGVEKNLESASKQSLRSNDLQDLEKVETEVKVLSTDPDSLTAKLDQQVIPVLEKMTKTGVLVDLKFLDKFGIEIKSDLAKIEEEIYKVVGHQFNLNSPKQLSEVLFDHLKLPVIKRTKTGRSTDEATLNELSSAHPVVPLLLRYRTLFKLVSTYIDALPKSVGEDGRIHSTFNVEGAATGRLSSTNPNLQNIPIRGTIGSELRKAFIASKGMVLLGADYSQIELRIMAHLADDSGLKKAFQENIDIHTLTAAKIFKLPVPEINKEQRAVGKTMNFATLYGQGPHALSKQLGVDFAIAKEYIAEYFEQYPKVREWMNKTLEFANLNGYVETIWGRKRYIPELQMQNKMMRAYGERAAINHPIQGSNADIIKKAMVEINKEFGISKLECKMILQIHDELLFECHPDCLKVASKIICQEMEEAIELSVPIKVEVKTGPNWAEMTPLQI